VIGLLGDPPLVITMAGAEVYPDPGFAKVTVIGVVASVQVTVAVAPEPPPPTIETVGRTVYPIPE
jgi:hypothetical protein